MEFQSTETEAVEKALKDLIDQWDTKAWEEAGQKFVNQLELDCGRQSGTYIDRVKKRLNRDLTDVEEKVLEFYYFFFCLANIVLQVASQPDITIERIRKSKETIRRSKEELRKSIEELQKIEEELREMK